jgi:hypothetical protein
MLGTPGGDDIEFYVVAFADLREWVPGTVSPGTVSPRSERKGRRSFDTAIEYGRVAIVATEKTRTAKSAVRATCYLSNG